MLRTVLVSAALLTTPIPMAASAQGAQQAQNNRQCDQSAGARTRRGIMGGLLGGIANRVTGGHLGGIPLPTQMLTDAIVNLLDCREQAQAAAATDEAIRGGVGTTTEWTSESRPGVRGASTVTGVEPQANGGDCMTVTDIVIVNGEETRAPKRMCRVPPARRYTRVA